MQASLHKKDMLFIDKVFLSRLPCLIRGVELFNLKLIEDIAQSGRPVDVVCHKSWVQKLSSLDCAEAINAIQVSSCSRPDINGILCALKLWRLKSKPYRVMLLGNVANGLIPALWILRKSGLYEKGVLIAHREPSGRFLRALCKDSAVVAVNRQIASQFREAGFTAEADYGVTDFSAIESRTELPGDEKQTVDFCLLGYLDNAWKGADTAIAAFQGLPAEVRKKSRLHLVAFKNPPMLSEHNIIPYNWMESSEIPEFLSSMDVMIVASRDENVMRETFCQAMVQGMLSGLPVIANKLQVLTEKLDQGGGLVFSTTEDLTRAMDQLFRDKPLREHMGNQARTTAKNRYIWRTADFLERYC